MKATGTGGSAPGMAIPPLFREAQRFRVWSFLVPVLIVMGVVWWQFVEQVMLDQPRGSDSLPAWTAWILLILFGIGFPAFAAVVRLVTEVRPGELTVRLIPFRTKRVSIRDIKSAMVREYLARKEFGGWGIRVGRNGRAYNASGNMGVQLTLTNEDRILIGSQRSEELLAALRLGGLNVD